MACLYNKSGELCVKTGKPYTKILTKRINVTIMKLKNVVLMATAAALSVAACTKESTVCDTEKVTYNNQIKTIFAGCTDAGCHNSSSVNGSLANYQDAVNFPKKSKLIGALKWEEGFVQMPSGKGKLSDCDISKVEKWIDSGYPEN